MIFEYDEFFGARFWLVKNMKSILLHDDFEKNKIVKKIMNDYIKELKKHFGVKLKKNDAHDFAVGHAMLMCLELFKASRDSWHEDDNPNGIISPENFKALKDRENYIKYGLVTEIESGYRVEDCESAFIIFNMASTIRKNAKPEKIYEYFIRGSMIELWVKSRALGLLEATEEQIDGWTSEGLT